MALKPPVSTRADATGNNNPSFPLSEQGKIADAAKTNQNALGTTRTNQNAGEQTRMPNVARTAQSGEETLGVPTGNTAADNSAAVGTELDGIDSHPLDRPNTSPNTPDGDGGAAGAPGPLGSGVRESDGSPKKGDPNNDDDLNQRPNETPADWRIRIKNRLQTVFGKSGWTSKILILGGLSIAVYTAILLARFDGTNSNVRITSVTIEKYSPNVNGFKKVTVASKVQM